MPLKLKRRGEVYHYEGTVAGHRLRASTKTTDKRTAQRIAAEAENRAWKCHLDGPGAQVTFPDALTAYLDAGKSQRFLLPLLEHFKDTPMREIMAGSIKAAALKLYPNASGATRNRQVIAPMLAVINHGAELGWCSPVKVKRYPVDPKKKIPATQEWVRAFAAQAEADGLPHLAAICLFMFGTAARVGEAVRLTWGDVDLQAGKANLSGDKPVPWTRTAKMHRTVVAALANIGGNRNPEELVFGYAGSGSVKKTWDNVIERAGIERLTPHCCRHGFATTLLRAGWDVATIAKVGGWKDASTVLRVYAHANEDNTVTDVLFDTPVTHRNTKKRASR